MGLAMDYTELLEKYNILLKQFDRLTKENIQLKAQLGLREFELIPKTISEKNTAIKIPDGDSPDRTSFSGVNNTSDSISKIKRPLQNSTKIGIHKILVGLI